VAKLTKAQAKRRLMEAKSKVIACASSSHITLEAAAKVCKDLDRLIARLK